MDRNGSSTARRTLRGALIAAALGLAVALLVTFTIGAFGMHMLGGRHAIYWLVAATGALVGVVVGNPIWRPDAGVEGALKGAFGAIAACALLYALRHLLPSEFDLGGVTYPWHLAAHPGILPMIAAPLGALFAFDHDEPSRVRVGGDIVRLRVEDTLPERAAEHQSERHEVRGTRAG